MKLDVGSGSRKHHKIIMDAIRTDVQKTGDNQGYLHVVCDAQHLPFRNSVFAKVRISHIAEHLNDPILAFQEALRILKRMGQLQIVVPHRMSHYARQKCTDDPFENHKWSFVPSWFQHVFKNFHCHIETTYRPLSFKHLRLVSWLLARPTEIIVVVTKVK